MIPVLFSANETDFESNGIGFLSDAITCNVIEERNGQYELKLRYPMDGIHADEIVDGCIITAIPSPYRSAQPFFVYAIRKTLSGMIEVNARHISYKLSGIPVAPFRTTTIASAMNGLKTHALTACPFDFWTDRTTAVQFDLESVSSIRAALGGQEGSILDVYGGEYEFDKFTVKNRNNRGVDNGVTIRYGKNMTELDAQFNSSDVRFGCIGCWRDSETGESVNGNIAWADGYTSGSVEIIDFSQDYQAKPSVEQLTASAQSYINSNSIQNPKISLDVSFAHLEQMKGYENIKSLEMCDICDTVTVQYEKLNCNVKAKIVKIDTDVLHNRYNSVTVGTIAANLATTIAEQEEVVKNIPDKNWISSAIASSSKAIIGSQGGYVRLLDTNSDGYPDTLYIADAAEPSEAVRVWRFNYEGWAGSKNGYDGDFEMVGTLDDGILANSITAGTLNAGVVKAGILQSPNSDAFSLNLDTGECIMKSENIQFGEDSLSSSLIDMASKVTNINESIAATNTITSQLQSEMIQVGGQIQANYSALTEIINNNQSEFEKYLVDTKAFIRQGFLEYDENGVPKVGIAIGQDLEVTGNVVNGYEELKSTQSCAFYEADKVSFRYGGNEIAYVSNQRLYISNAEITEKLIIKKWTVSQDANNGLVFKFEDVGDDA